MTQEETKVSTKPTWAINRWQDFIQEDIALFPETLSGLEITKVSRNLRKPHNKFIAEQNSVILEANFNCGAKTKYSSFRKSILSAVSEEISDLLLEHVMEVILKSLPDFGKLPFGNIFERKNRLFYCFQRFQYFHVLSSFSNKPNI